MVSDESNQTRPQQPRPKRYQSRKGCAPTLFRTTRCCAYAKPPNRCPLPSSPSLRPKRLRPATAKDSGIRWNAVGGSPDPGLEQIQAHAAFDSWPWPPRLAPLQIAGHLRSRQIALPPAQVYRLGRPFESAIETALRNPRDTPPPVPS